MYRSCQRTWPELGRGKKEDETPTAKAWWAWCWSEICCFKSTYNSSDTGRDSAVEVVLRHLCLLPEKILNSCLGPWWVSLSPEKVRHRPARGVLSLRDLQRERSAAPNSYMEALQRCEEMSPSSWGQSSLSELDKSSLGSQGSYRLVGQGTGTEMPVNMGE